MNWIIELKYSKARSKKFKVTKMRSNQIVRSKTEMIIDTALFANFEIPNLARIHPQGFRELVLLDNNFAQRVMFVLITALKTDQQKNIVELPLEVIVNDSKLSRTSVISTLTSLERHEYIEKVGKQKYKISPKVAWFGCQLEWAKELYLLNHPELDKAVLEKQLTFDEDNYQII